MTNAQKRTTGAASGGKGIEKGELLERKTSWSKVAEQFAVLRDKTLYQHCNQITMKMTADPVSSAVKKLKKEFRASGDFESRFIMAAELISVLEARKGWNNNDGYDSPFAAHKREIEGAVEDFKKQIDADIEKGTAEPRTLVQRSGYMLARSETTRELADWLSQCMCSQARQRMAGRHKDDIGVSEVIDILARKNMHGALESLLVYAHSDAAPETERARTERNVKDILATRNVYPGHKMEVLRALESVHRSGNISDYVAAIAENLLEKETAMNAAGKDDPAERHAAYGLAEHTLYFLGQLILDRRTCVETESVLLGIITSRDPERTKPALEVLAHAKRTGVTLAEYTRTQIASVKQAILAPETYALAKQISEA